MHENRVKSTVVGRGIPLSRIGLCSGYVLFVLHVLCSERVGLNSTVGAKKLRVLSRPIGLFCCNRSQSLYESDRRSKHVSL